jgi:hypothetical protein
MVLKEVVWHDKFWIRLARNVVQWLADVKLASKAVPLHAMEALGGRGGIALTHSRPRH